MGFQKLAERSKLCMAIMIPSKELEELGYVERYGLLVHRIWQTVSRYPLTKLNFRLQVVNI